MLRNIEQAKEIYPGWKVIVYYDNTVPEAVIQKIGQAGAITKNVNGLNHGMFWRFYAANIDDCGYAIFRDCDSRLSSREKRAVDKWMQSGKAIHIMRDHPLHEIPFGTDSMSILGGMWGIKGNIVSIGDMIDKFIKNKDLGYGIDQAFLKEIHTLFINDSLIHDEFFSKKPFPIRRDNYRFIGERIDENEQPVGNDWEAIKLYYEKRPEISNSFLNSVKNRLSKLSKVFNF